MKTYSRCRIPCSTCSVSSLNHSCWFGRLTTQRFCGHVEVDASWWCPELLAVECTGLGWRKKAQVYAEALVRSSFTTNLMLGERSGEVGCTSRITIFANILASLLAVRLQWCIVHVLTSQKRCIVRLQSGIMSQLKWEEFLMVVTRDTQSPSTWIAG